MDAAYNDVQEWKYKDVLSTFGADSAKYQTYHVETQQEAESLFQSPTFNAASRLQVSHRAKK